MFVEIIDVGEPGKRVALSLDEHVTVGGSYFDALRGEYVIEAQWRDTPSPRQRSQNLN